jgi:hypothetical protein
LYFQTKDAVQGVTIDIRQMQNGIPTASVIPYSTVNILPASVNISNNANTATTVTFKAPIFLPSDNFYAITISPDGANPNYRVYTSAVGGADLQTDSPVFKNWGQGDLLTSTNGNTWNPKTSTTLINWRGMAISASGQYQTITSYQGKIYSSNNYGETWTILYNTVLNWWCVSMSSSGQYQTLGEINGNIYISNNYGNTWTQKLSGTNRAWSKISISSSGQYQIGSVSNGYIYVSSDYGNTWTQSFTINTWSGVISSSGQ